MLIQQLFKKFILQNNKNVFRNISLPFCEPGCAENVRGMTRTSGECASGKGAGQHQLRAMQGTFIVYTPMQSDFKVKSRHYFLKQLY